MRINFALMLLFSLCVIPTFVKAQDSEVQKRTQDLKTLLNKEKNKSAEKGGVRKGKYKEIRNEAVVKKNLRDYAGVYEVSGLGYTVEIRVTNDGKIEANGSEPKDGNPQQGRRFRLENVKVEGALITAAKIYEDGTTEKFEGVFINRLIREGSSPEQAKYTEIAFGLGVVGIDVKVFDEITLDRLFYSFKE